MNLVKTYLVQLQKAHALGDATEHTHRAALQQLIESTLPALQATNEPRAQQRENKPDDVVRQAGAMIGFIEAKDIGIDLKPPSKQRNACRPSMPPPLAPCGPVWPSVAQCG
jgi:hypothetical protein